MKVMPISA